MSIFTELADHALLPFEEARMLPAAAYCSPAVLAEEHRRIFAREWSCVGRTADLPRNGDYLSAEIPSPDPMQPGGHRSIIVVRGDDGMLAAFHNTCVHRGSQLLEGCGNEARITCPYHAWVYRLDGQLVGAPYMSRTVDSHGNHFDPAEHRLTALRLEEWEGFVFVTLNPAALELKWRLAGLAGIVGRYRMAGYVPVHHQVDVWDTNWKLLFENFMDAYHVFKVHRNTFAKNGDNTLKTTMHPGTDDYAYHLVGHDATATSGVAHRANTALDGDWRHTIVLGAAFPTHVMQLQPDWLWYLQLSPLGVDRVRIRWDVSVAPEVLADQADPDGYVIRLLDLLNKVNAEDRPIVEGVHRGVRGGGVQRGGCHTSSATSMTSIATSPGPWPARRSRRVVDHIKKGTTMTTTGVDHYYVETHDWAKAVAFWKSLGFEIEFDTGHGSGMLRHPAGGPGIFVAEQSVEDPLATELYFGAGADFVAPDGVDVALPFHDTHWGTRVMVIQDPDGHRFRIQTPAG